MTIPANLHADEHDARRQHVFVYGTLMRGEIRGLDQMPEHRACFAGLARADGHALAVPRGAERAALGSWSIRPVRCAQRK